MQKTDKKRMIIAAVCFAVFAVTVWFLVKAIFFPTVELGLKRLPAIAFFTIQSNILAAAWLLYAGLCELTEKLPRLKPVLGLMLCCYITVTGIVYWAVLVPMLGFEKELFAASNVWMHTVTPIVVPVVFALMPKTKEISARSVIFMLVYPFLYTVYAYILHRAIGVYVYPFYNPSVMGSWLMIMIALVLMAGVFVGFGFLYRRIWNRRSEKQSSGLKQQAQPSI